MTKIAIIARNPIDSPNMTANDAAILECIGAELSRRGAEVLPVGEDDDIPNDTQVVCTMSRTPSTIKRLKSAEEQGIIVVNSTTAVGNCSRKCFMEILRSNSIPQPQYCIIGSINEVDDNIFPCWIKKADGWSSHSDDVSFAQTREDANEILSKLALRGIAECIQMQHCPGDIVKFYGVGNDFFHHCYPAGTKFGKEEINGAPRHYGFDANALKYIAQKAALAMGLEIYGGDAIITQQGQIYIIDMNDFPSFTAIRDIAAKEIAALIMNKTE